MPSKVGRGGALRNEKKSGADARPRGHEISRLEGFSDAVFGFAATLLVVSLEVPKTFPELFENLSGFAAFGLSFFALVLIWAGHNAFFRRYGLSDPWTVCLNSLLLFVVLFYVYPLKFMTSGLVQNMFGIGRSSSTAVVLETLDELSLLFVIYSGGFVAVFSCMALLHANAYRQRDRLGLTAAERIASQGAIGYYLIFALVGAVSVLLAWSKVGLNVVAPGWIYGILGPLCWLNGTLNQKKLDALKR